MTRPDRPEPIVVYGAGGFGREVLDVVEAINSVRAAFEFIGFLDDGAVDGGLLRRRDAPLLDDVLQAVRLGARFVIGIGSAEARRSIDARVCAAGLVPATLVHPAATVGSEITFGPGCIVTAGVRVTTNITCGRHVDLHVNCTIGHDSVLEDFVSVFPGATVSGNVTIRNGATIGTGANVLPGLTIGSGSFVGAGAVVTRDVPDSQVVVGSPARPLRRARADAQAQRVRT